MSNVQALAKTLEALNELLEHGERVPQLVVTVPEGADGAAVARAITAEAAHRGVRLELVEQVVTVKREVDEPALKAAA